MNENTLSLRFFGVEDLKPATLRAKELGDLITALEEAVVAVVRAHDPQVKKEQVSVPLTSLAEGSVNLDFIPTFKEFTLPAAKEIVEAFTTNSFRDLPIAALSPLRTIVNFVRRRGCQAEFRVGQLDAGVVALITPDTRIETFLRIQGETELYGQVIRTGGVEPKVEIKTIQGDTIYCEASQEITKQLGQRLYEQVHLYGIATWDFDTLEIEEFRIVKATLHEATPITDTFDALHSVIGDYFDQIEDVERWVSDLRKNEDMVHGDSMLGHKRGNLGH